MLKRHRGILMLRLCVHTRPMLVSSHLVVSLQKVLFTCAIIINKDVFSKLSLR